MPKLKTPTWESLRAQYEHAIGVLIGQPASTFSLAGNALAANPPAIPVGVPSELLERRPDIAAAERLVAQANAQIGVAKAAYYPTIQLSASGGFGTSSIADWFTWPSRFWSVGPSLTETIFDAGLRKATVQQYRATYDQTVANYEQTVLTAFQQVEDNLASLRILSQDIEQQDAAVGAATRSLQEATVRYRSGLDPYLNVISAQTVLSSDQQIAVNFRMQQMVAAVGLIKALGGGSNASEIPSPKEVTSRDGRYRARSRDPMTGQMLRVRPAANAEVVLTLSGRMNAENLAELERLIRSEVKGRRIALDLKDLTLVGRDAVVFLGRCEAGSFKAEEIVRHIVSGLTEKKRRAIPG